MSVHSQHAHTREAAGWRRLTAAERRELRAGSLAPVERALADLLLLLILRARIPSDDFDSVPGDGNSTQIRR